VPDDVAVFAELMLADAKWQTVSWRGDTKDRLTCRFAAGRVQVADGYRHRMSDDRVQAMPGGQEVWLVSEKRKTGEQKYYLSNLPADTTLKAFPAAIKARWICEQAHQQLKDKPRA
jgi:SRSO17 transposase